MTTGKTIALTRWTFVGKVMSLLFNMLSRLITTFLPRSKRLLISWLEVTICSDLGVPKNKVCHCFHCCPIYLPRSDGAMLSKSSIQFSVDGWGCVPSLLFTWGQTMVEVMKIMTTSFKRSHAGTATLSAQPCSRPPPTHASAGDSWTLTGKSGSVSCGVTAPFSWVQVRTRFCLCPPRVSFPSPV